MTEPTKPITLADAMNLGSLNAMGMMSGGPLHGAKEAEGAMREYCRLRGISFDDAVAVADEAAKITEGLNGPSHED